MFQIKYILDETLLIKYFRIKYFSVNTSIRFGKICFRLNTFQMEYFSLIYYSDKIFFGYYMVPTKYLSLNIFFS